MTYIGEEEEEFPLVTKKQFELFLKRFGPPEKSLLKVNCSFVSCTKHAELS